MEQQGLLIACYSRVTGRKYIVHVSKFVVCYGNDTNPGDTPYTRPLAISLMQVTTKVTAY